MYRTLFSISALQQQQLETKVTSLQTDIQTLQTKKEAIQRPLKLYEELKFDGFDQRALENLAYTCRKYNRNMKDVLEAVNTYADLAQIQEKAIEADDKRQHEETRFKEIKEKRAHLQATLDMCDTLLNRFNYSVIAIQELHEIAKKYGEPIEMIKAIESYGELRNIEAEIEDLARRKIELESGVKEMITQMQSLKGQSASIAESIAGLLQQLSTEISKTFQKAFQELSFAYTEQLTSIRKESQQDAQRQAEQIALQEEIRLGKTIRSVVLYPKASKLSQDDVLLLLHAVDTFCLATGIDPKIRLDEAIDNVYNPLLCNIDVHVRQLIDGAKRGLLRGSVLVPK